MRFPKVVVLLLTSVAGCHYASPDLAYVPDSPTYDHDVRPLLSDHCVLCHGNPPNRGAPHTYRLDLYGDTDHPLGAQFCFTVTVGSDTDPYCLRRIVKEEMPPAAKDGDGVGPNGIEMLRRWIANGLPEQ